MPKIADPNIRARQLSKAVVQAGGNLAEAGRRLGITRQSVRAHIQKNELVKSAMTKALERAGVSDSVLAQKLKDKLEATCMVSGGKGNPPIETEDNGAQLKAVELCMKIKGHIKSTEVNVDASQKTLQVFNKLNDEEFDIASVQGMIADLNSGLSGQRKQ